MKRKPNGFDIFRAGAYLTRGNWANVDDFCDYFKKDFAALDFDGAAVLKKIDELQKEEPVAGIGQKEALAILARRDLRAVVAAIKRLNLNLEVEIELNGSLAKLQELLADFGIKYDRSLFIVDHFPKPYDFFDKIGTNGTNFDDADHEMFGLEQGVYLKRQNLKPLISIFILAHEIIHNVVSFKDSNYLARGLEEGFTQLFGEIYLCGQLLGYDAALNNMINKRMRLPVRELRWELYVDWLRQGCVFYREFGIDGIAEAMKRGRKFVKKADTLMLQGRLNEIDLPKSGWIKELDETATMILAYNRNMAYSPLAVYLAQNLKKDDDVALLLSKLGVKKNEGSKALKELNEKIFSILAARGRIAIDDTKLYIESNNLRYEIPKS
ncbi:MAG: hypothetical protein MUD10_00670 [Candidatus Pacebacteria bacterium]|jgi:hypothetical protein|nr:hypothetical protein [Candidatus Paceibacterota bacterium]